MNGTTDTITTLDEFEAAFSAGLNIPLQPKPWKTVTDEWLNRFADGAGDYNPLFKDEEYAQHSRFHQLTAAPAFLFSINFGAVASIWGHLNPKSVPMDSLTILYLGASIKWHGKFWLGDKVRSIETPVSVERKMMRQTGEGLICTGRTDYYNHRGELVATIHNKMLRFENPGKGVESAVRDQGGQRAPDPLVWSRKRRGTEPLFGEDVSVGEDIPELDKGTYTRTELYLFAHAALNTRRAAVVEGETIDVGAGGRADPEYAKKSRAQAGSFDFGPQRICWLTQIVTDWMGDHGDLLEIDARLLRPNLVGDTSVVRGVVKEVSPAGDRVRVRLDLQLINQIGMVTASAVATVSLPTRGAVLENDVLFSSEVSDDHGLYG